MIEFIKDILTSREPGEGFFGGAEGAIRFVILSIIVSISYVVYLLV
jgi:hypothetical protein